MVKNLIKQSIKYLLILPLLLCSFLIHCTSVYAENSLIFEKGTMITIAVENGDSSGNDYEFIVELQSYGDSGFSYDWSMGAPNNWKGSRSVSAKDWDSATFLNDWYYDNETGPKPGSVSLCFPKMSFQQLKQGSVSELTVAGEGQTTFKSTGKGEVAVLVNGETWQLPAIMIQDNKGRNTALLDDDDFPLTLVFNGKWSSQIVSIKTRTGKKVKTEKEILATEGQLTTYGIHFNTASAQIQPESQSTLNEVIAFLKDYPDARLLIEGHTDYIGTDDYNMDLSVKRSESVKKYLVETGGISASRFETKGFGESQPIGDNKTLFGRAKNRRVIFKKIK